MSKFNTEDNKRGEPRIVLINTFVPKEGHLDAFIDLQTAFLGATKDVVGGWRGSRLHRSLDGKTAVMMTAVRSVEDHHRWLQTETFVRHRAEVGQLVESVNGSYYEVVCEAGDF